jgi:hypothetical protein
VFRPPFFEEAMSALESRERGDSPGEGGSNRNFGLLFCGAFVVVGLWPLWHQHAVRWWAVALGVGFGAVAAVAPGLLAPLRRAWMGFGWLLGKVVSPIVMGILLYAIVTPVGLFQRLTRRDPLHLAWDRKAETYWQFRKPPGPAPDTMTNQF